MVNRELFKIIEDDILEYIFIFIFSEEIMFDIRYLMLTILYYFLYNKKKEKKRKKIF